MKGKYAKLLIVIAAFLILGLTSVGSYAYFVLNVSGNDEAQQTVITSGTMSLYFDENPYVEAYNMYPSQSVIKDFYLMNTGDIATTYDVYLSELLNEFVDKEDLVYTIKSTRVGNENSIVQGCDVLTEQVMPSESGSDSKIISSCTIEPNQVHYYEMKITFKDDGTNQDDNKGKRFSGRLSINEVHQEKQEQIAYLEPGTIVNRKIKELVGINYGKVLNFNYYWNYSVVSGITEYNFTIDEKIENIEISSNAPTSSDNAIKISDLSSYYDVYAWYKNKKLYIYTPADKIYLNYNSDLLFANFKSLKNLDLSFFDTSRVNTMAFMLAGLQNATSINLGDNFTTPNLTICTGLFSHDKKITSIDLSNFDTTYVQNMAAMFQETSSLQTIDLSSFDTSNVSDMGRLFYKSGASSVILGDSFYTSDVENMPYMFRDMPNITTIDLGENFDTSNVTNMQGFIAEDPKLISINLGDNFDTSNVTNMQSLFYNLPLITEIDLGDKFEVSNVVRMKALFKDCPLLRTIYCDNNWTFNSSVDATQIFYNLPSLTGGQGTKWVNTANQKKYAKVDGGTSNPGYFTSKSN